MLTPVISGSLNALDDAVLSYAYSHLPIQVDSLVTIDYSIREADSIPFFELSALVESLRSLLLRSRPLTSQDLALHDESGSASARSFYVDPQRIPSCQQILRNPEDPKGINEALAQFVQDLQPLLPPDPLDPQTVIPLIDAKLDIYITIARSAAGFGLHQAGLGFAYEWRRHTANRVLKKLSELVTRWKEHLAEFDDLLNKHDNLPVGATDQERISLLRQAGRSTEVAALTLL
jgi:hypothetical protein